MSELFDKISTLLNAQLNDLLGKNPQSPLARVRLDAKDAAKNPDGSAQSLRRRLEEAIDYEDELQARIDERTREVVELDKLVDDMLGSGDSFSARRLQSQLNTKQRQLNIAESELREHRLLTRHLMAELSKLEAALDSQEGSASTSRRRRIPLDGVAAKGAPGAVGAKAIFDSVSGKFEETRTNLEHLLGGAPESGPREGPAASQRFEIIDEEPDPRKAKARKQDAPDMDARLSRLSKPPDDAE